MEVYKYMDLLEEALYNGLEGYEWVDLLNYYDWDEFVDEIYGDLHRWDIDVTSIRRKGDKYYAIYWSKGLTENQENDFSCAYIEEVTPVKRTVEVTEWMER